MSSVQTAAPRRDIDARALPSYGYGASSLMWWGTVGVMAIEGTVFALAIMMYFYVRTSFRPMCHRHSSRSERSTR